MRSVGHAGFTAFVGVIPLALREIPPLKAIPEDIRPFLELMDRHKGNRQEMYRAIHQYLTNRSRRGSRSERNSVFAICLPTMRYLHLIEGRGDAVGLSGDGRTLLAASRTI